MELAQRIAQVIIPVFFIVAVGYFYGRKARPDLSAFNRVVLDVLAPMLVYSALAARDFKLQDHTLLLLGGTAVILIKGSFGRHCHAQSDQFRVGRFQHQQQASSLHPQGSDQVQKNGLHNLL